MKKFLLSWVLIVNGCFFAAADELTDLIADLRFKLDGLILPLKANADLLALNSPQNIESVILQNLYLYLYLQAFSSYNYKSKNSFDWIQDPFNLSNLNKHKKELIEIYNGLKKENQLTADQIEKLLKWAQKSQSTEGMGGVPPPPGTGVVPPPPGTGVVPPPPGTGGVPPPQGTGGVPPPQGAGGVPPPQGTGVVPPQQGTGVVPPPPGTDLPVDGNVNVQVLKLPFFPNGDKLPENQFDFSPLNNEFKVSLRRGGTSLKRDVQTITLFTYEQATEFKTKMQSLLVEFNRIIEKNIDLTLSQYVVNFEEFRQLFNMNLSDEKIELPLLEKENLMYSNKIVSAKGISDFLKHQEIVKYMSENTKDNYKNLLENTKDFIIKSIAPILKNREQYLCALSITKKVLDLGKSWNKKNTQEKITQSKNKMDAFFVNIAQNIIENVNQEKIKKWLDMQNRYIKKAEINTLNISIKDKKIKFKEELPQDNMKLQDKFNNVFDSFLKNIENIKQDTIWKNLEEFIKSEAVEPLGKILISKLNEAKKDIQGSYGKNITINSIKSLIESKKQAVLKNLPQENSKYNNIKIEFDNVFDSFLEDIENIKKDTIWENLKESIRSKFEENWCSELINNLKNFRLFCEKTLAEIGKKEENFKVFQNKCLEFISQVNKELEAFKTSKNFKALAGAVKIEEQINTLLTQNKLHYSYLKECPIKKLSTIINKANQNNQESSNSVKNEDQQKNEDPKKTIINKIGKYLNEPYFEHKSLSELLLLIYTNSKNRFLDKKGIALDEESSKALQELLKSVQNSKELPMTDFTCYQALFKMLFLHFFKSQYESFKELENNVNLDLAKKNFQNTYEKVEKTSADEVLKGIIMLENLFPKANSNSSTKIKTEKKSANVFDVAYEEAKELFPGVHDTTEETINNLIIELKNETLEQNIIDINDDIDNTNKKLSLLLFQKNLKEEKENNEEADAFITQMEGLSDYIANEENIKAEEKRKAEEEAEKREAEEKRKNNEEADAFIKQMGDLIEEENRIANEKAITRAKKIGFENVNAYIDYLLKPQVPGGSLNKQAVENTKEQNVLNLDYERALKNFEDEKSKLENQIKVLKERLVEAQNAPLDNNDRDATIAGLQEENRNLTRQINILTGEKQGLTTTNTNLTNENDHLNNRIQNLEAQINQLNADKINLNNRITELQNAQQGEEMQNLLDGNRTNNQIEGLHEQINQLSIDKANLKNQLNNLQQEKDRVDNENRALRDQNQVLTNTNIKLGNANRGLTGTNTNLTNEKDFLTNRNQELEEQINQLNTEKTNLKIRLAAQNDALNQPGGLQNLFDQEKAQLEEQVRNLKQEQQQLNTDKRDLQEHVDVLTAQINQLNADKINLNNQLNNLQQEKDRVDNEKIELANANQNLNNDKQGLTAENQKLTNTNNALTEQVRALTQAKEDLNAEKTDFQNRINELQRANIEHAEIAKRVTKKDVETEVRNEVEEEHNAYIDSLNYDNSLALKAKDEKIEELQNKNAGLEKQLIDAGLKPQDVEYVGRGSSTVFKEDEESKEDKKQLEITVKHQNEVIVRYEAEMKKNAETIKKLEVTVNKQRKELDDIKNKKDEEGNELLEMIDQKQKELDRLQKELEDRDTLQNKKQAELDKKQAELDAREKQLNQLERKKRNF